MPRTIEPLADHPEISATIGRDLKEFAATRGIDIEPFAVAIGIDTEVFGSNDARLPLDRFARLLDALATVTDDETFGLQYGLAHRTGGGGYFGYGLLNAPTLGDALVFARSYIVSVVDVMHHELHDDSRGLRYEWNFSPLITRKSQFIDFALRSLLTGMSAFKLEQTTGVLIEINRPTPKSPSAYRALLPRRVVFDCDVNAISVPRALTSLRNPDADPRLYELLLEQCRRIAETRNRRASVVDQARHYLLRCEGKDSSLSRIANFLGLSPRSFQRRLSELGTSYQEIFDETRRELSDRLLRETDLTIGQISDRLGFSAPSAYSRSAARWYGKSPSRFRAEMRRRDADDATAMGSLTFGAKQSRKRR